MSQPPCCGTFDREASFTAWSLAGPVWLELAHGPEVHGDRDLLPRDVISRKLNVPNPT